MHAAEAFDATGSRDPGEFVEFMERHTAREPEGAEVIRVMTIHKSKGLGFDLVLVPDLEGQTLMQRREGLAVQKRPDHSVDWILDLPPGFICDHDPALSAHVREAEAAACYEQLSLLYVALTRAKHGLYVITKPPGTSKSANFPRLLASTLGSAAMADQRGEQERDWILEPGRSRVGPKAQGQFRATCAAGPAPALLPRSAARPASRLNARRPSDEPTGRLPAERLFALAGGREAEHGAQVHALLKTVGWADAAQRSRLASEWAAGGGPGAEAAACLLSPELARVWERPAVAAEVWMERAFDMVLDGDWVSGKFDRVILERDAAGHPSAATLFDFKTDRIEAGAGSPRRGRSPRGPALLVSPGDPSTHRPAVGGGRRRGGLHADRSAGPASGRLRLGFTAPRAPRSRFAKPSINSIPHLTHHGQPEEETPFEDEQAQAPEALEGESPQKAHVAEMSGRSKRSP